MIGSLAAAHGRPTLTSNKNKSARAGRPVRPDGYLAALKHANPADYATEDGLRFVDCDMHIMEPVDLFDKYLEKKFCDRVVLPVDSKGQFKRGMIVIDGQATSLDHEMQQHRLGYRTSP